MDGLELLRRLRALPGGSELPILALSGFLSRLEESRTDQRRFHRPAGEADRAEPPRRRRFASTCRQQRDARAASSAERRRLLVVDDDPVQLKLARIHFSQLGFEVTAVGGAARRTRRRASRPAGCDSQRRLHAATPTGSSCVSRFAGISSLADVPVVLLSGQYGSTADQDLARRVGANALVLRTPDFGERCSGDRGRARDPSAGARGRAERSARAAGTRGS